MPTIKEIADALDTLRQLINGPLPGARERRIKFLELYRVLRMLQPDHDLEAVPVKPKPDPLGGISLDLPFVEEE